MSCAAIGTSSSPTSDQGQGCSSTAAGGRFQAETEQMQQDSPDTSSKHAGTAPLHVASCLPNLRVSRLVQDLTSCPLVITAFSLSLDHQLLDLWITSCTDQEDLCCASCRFISMTSVYGCLGKSIAVGCGWYRLCARRAFDQLARRAVAYWGFNTCR